MLSYAFMFALVMGGGADTVPVADTASIPLPTPVAAVPAVSLADTVRKRPRPVEYSDLYATRLMIHRIGSYTMLPLFGAEWALGQNLMNGNSASWVRPAHGVVATGVGALFTINTITGVWNLWDARNDPADRTRRYVHSALMIAADAGFAITGALGSNSASPSDRRLHRNVALGSMAVSTIGSAMMWFWKD